MITTQQPTHTDHAASQQADGDPTTTADASSHDPRDVSDAQAVAMLRRWFDDYQAHPEEHSYFPSIARMFFKSVKALDDEEKRRAATHRAGAVKSYLTQPVGSPEGIPTTLDVDDSYTVFRVVLHAVQTWQPDDQVLPNEAAHRALIEATEALQIMARAQLTEMGPLVQAHRDDDRAAQEWASDRWMARSQPLIDR
jgi:hypothetical protein